MQYSFSNQRVTVMGLGRFGGGAGAVRFLSNRGARMTLTDLAAESSLADSLAEIADCRIESLHLGGHCEDDFTQADLIVASPAVPRSNPFLQLARTRGIPVTSEMNLFFDLQRGKIVGVTGSNGKSTTTAMIHSILQAGGWNCSLGGNIGRSLLPEVDRIDPEHWSVLELSSFQLEDLDEIRRSPQVAVVTNFSPNHLDRHGTIQEYRRAKQTILRWQTRDDFAVLNADDADVAGWETAGARWLFGSSAEVESRGVWRAVEPGRAVIRLPGCPTRSLPLGQWVSLPGEHNIQNAMAATAAAACALGIPLDAVERGLKSFHGLPHRLEFVGEWRGRRFYNDSIATTPESVAVALEAFAAPIVLLAGGYDKGIDLSGLARMTDKRVKAVALMGQTGPAIEAGLTTPLRKVCESFEQSFAWAVEQSQPGDIVLLSPGCASYDWFTNFTERGKRFTAMVKTLPSET